VFAMGRERTGVGSMPTTPGLADLIFVRLNPMFHRIPRGFEVIENAGAFHAPFQQV